jgi:hypothetical protein
MSRSGLFNLVQVCGMQVGMQAAPAFRPAKPKSRQKGVPDPPELTQDQ